MHWFVIGISGVTCGGKTTLTNSLYTKIKEEIPQVKDCKIIHQDDYFLPVDHANHTWIPQLNHINWEILSSLDMKKMYEDLKKILVNKINGQWDKKIKQFYNRNSISETSLRNSDDHVITDNINVLIIEGFLILNYPLIRDLCDLKFHIDLSKEQCFERRTSRIYDPPDVEGYFDLCVWPQYLIHKEEILQTDTDILDGTRSDLANYVLNILKFIFEKSN